MPNWCTNYVEFRGDAAKLKKIEEFCQGEYTEYSGDASITDMEPTDYLFKISTHRKI